LSRNHYWFFHRRRHLAHSLDAPLEPDGNETLSDVVASEAADLAEEAAFVEHAFVITTCMSRLPASQCDILTRRVVQNCSYAEIARDLGLNMGTVKSRLARARESLRTEISASGP
jgi:RNA polymerase sigma-70 factor (ECF subfamily)